VQKSKCFTDSVLVQTCLWFDTRALPSLHKLY